MPHALPLWPPPFNPTVPHMHDPLRPATVATRRRWLIVENGLPFEVSEEAYREALATSDRVEVARYPHEDVVTYLCYRTPSAK